MLRQTEDMSVAEYQARFLMLERFAHDSSTSERERAAQFVSGLRISVRSVVATFSCATLAEAVMRALQNEHAHVSHHQERAVARMVQPSCERSQGWYQQQDYEPQRQTMDAGVAAFEGQQVQGVPLQTQTFQTRAQQTGGDQELPYCSHCLGRHWGRCWTYDQ